MSEMNQPLDLKQTAVICTRLINDHYGLDVSDLSAIEIENLMNMLVIIQLSNLKSKGLKDT